MQLNRRQLTFLCRREVKALAEASSESHISACRSIGADNKSGDHVHINIKHLGGEIHNRKDILS